jgi:hypothetical protein
MAASKTEIANSALMKIGGKLILSLDDPDKEATLCKARMDPCIKAVLRMHPWNCAMVRVSLAPTVAVPPFGYAYKFLLPGDCLRVLPLGSFATEDEFDIEDKHLLCDISAIDVIYIKNVTDVSRFDPLLDEAISAYLAWDISYSLTQSSRVRDDAFITFRSLLVTAKSANAQEGGMKVLEANTWLESRLTYAGRKAPNV